MEEISTKIIRHTQFLNRNSLRIIMKIFIIFILLGLSRGAIGGGESKCGSLQANYLVLLQACEYLLDESLKTVNS